MNPYYLTATAFISPSRITYEIYNFLLQLARYSLLLYTHHYQLPPSLSWNLTHFDFFLPFTHSCSL